MKVFKKQISASNEITPTNRIIYLDYLKALAITLVIIYHCHVFDGNCFISAILSMCVPIFFCINGYLMLRKHHDAITMLKKNVKLVLLLCFWGVISCCIGTWSMDNSEFIPSVMIKHLYSLDVGYGNHLWFLVTLIILNFLNPALYYFVSQSNKIEKTIFIAFVAICTLNFFHLFAWRFNPVQGWLTNALLYYVVGFFCIANYEKIKLSISKISMILIFFVLLQTLLNVVMLNDALIMKLFNGGDLVFNQYKSVFVVCSTITLVLLCSKLSFSTSKIIGFIGQNTLGIYFVQDFVIKYLKYGLSFDKYPIIYTGLSLLLSCSVVWMFNKCKLTKFLISM